MTELNGVIQIAIPARDIDRATAFYRDTLGFGVMMKGPNMSFLACGDIRIYLDANLGDTAGGNSLVYFRATNIEHAHTELKGSEVKIHREPHVIASLPDRDVWLMWIRDSESNLLGIMEERRK